VIQYFPFCLIFSVGYLVVIEVIYEGSEASGLVLQSQCQHGNMADEYCVEEPSHLQVVTGTKRLKGK